jgi:hypothetical protein
MARKAVTAEDYTSKLSPLVAKEAVDQGSFISITPKSLCDFPKSSPQSKIKNPFCFSAKRV